MSAGFRYVDEHCHRCGADAVDRELVSTVTLCGDCRDDLKTKSPVMFSLDLERWHRRPLVASTIYERLHAA